MADELVPIGATGNHARLADQGDGSFAPVVATAPRAPVRVTYTNRSGTITAGGTAQVLAPANAARNSLFIQNNSAGPLWVDFGVTAVLAQPSIELLPGDQLRETSSVSVQSISIIGATTGQTFTAKEG